MKAYVWMSFPKCFPHSLSTFNFNTRALVQKNRKLLSLKLLYRAGVRPDPLSVSYNLFPHPSPQARHPRLSSSSRALQNDQGSGLLRSGKERATRWLGSVIRNYQQHRFGTTACARKMLFLREILKIVSFLFKFLFHF